MPRGSIEAELGDVKEICVEVMVWCGPPARTVGSPGAATMSCNRRACGRQRAPKRGVCDVGDERSRHIEANAPS